MGSERARRLRRRAEIHGLRSARRHRRLRLRRPTPSLRRPPASLLKPELAASGGEAAAVNEYDGGIAVASYMYGERVHTRYDRLESEATRVGVTSPFTTFQSLAILSFFITHRPPPYLDTLGLLSLSPHCSPRLSLCSEVLLPLSVFTSRPRRCYCAPVAPSSPQCRRWCRCTRPSAPYVPSNLTGRSANGPPGPRPRVRRRWPRGALRPGSSTSRADGILTGNSNSRSGRSA